MKGLSVGHRIIASFALVVAVMLASYALVYERALQNEARATRVQEQDVSGMVKALKIRGALTAHLLQTNHLLVGQQAGEGDTELNQRSNSLAEAAKHLAQTLAEYPSTIAQEKDRALYNLATQEIDTYLQEHQTLMAMVQAQQFQAANRYASGTLFDEWNSAYKAVAEMMQLNEEQVRHAMEGVNQAARANRATTIVSVLLAVLIALVSGFLLHRHLLRPIEATLVALKQLGTGDLSTRLNMQRRDEFNNIEQGFNNMADSLRGLVTQAQRSAVQLTTSITEIAATSKEQQATVSESAATTTEIGATSREIASTARELVQSMGDVSHNAEHTAVLAGSGQMGVARMGEVMTQLTKAAELVSAKLSLLNEQAGNINQVVTTIVKVADQTNLLSLNAAIEAEKAGEYGRGFAVVATEVRRLADQTAIATYDIELMVREIQSAVSAGVMGMDKFSDEVRRGNQEMLQVSEQLSQIIYQVQALAPRVQLANEGMQAQATGAEQINQALAQLSEAGAQTVESLQQAGIAIDNMNEVANSLRTGVSRFKV